MHSNQIIRLALIVIATFTASSGQSQQTEIAVASKKFTESVILGEIITAKLQANAIPSRHKSELGGTQVLWKALVRGDIDVYPDYTGTIRYEIIQNPQLKTFKQLQEVLRQQGIGMLAPLGFNNSYAIGMTKTKAKSLNINKISDLKNHPNLVFGFGHEFLDRNDGWPGLQARYKLKPESVKGMDHDIGYKAIESGKIDVIDLYSTDAEIDYLSLIALVDDLNYFPDYQGVILYRLDLDSKAVDSLAEISGTINESSMIQMNSLAKISGQEAAIVAKQFLKSNFDLEVTAGQSLLFTTIVVRSQEHLFLVSVSLLLAILIAVPLGYLASLSEGLARLTLTIVGIIQTIPSLALLVIMIPLLGIGTLPALMALFLYSLLPIVRATHHGFTSIDRDIRESAVALGLPSSYRLFKIYTPLVTPAILSGIKTSAVINVGTATLGALIGAGGYGQTILKGIRLDNHNLILAGAVPAAILAILAQSIFDLIERIARPPGSTSQ